MPFQIYGMDFLPLVSTNEEKFLIEDKQFISLSFMACDFCIKDIFIYYLLKTVWLLPTPHSGISSPELIFIYGVGIQFLCA